MSVLVWVGEVQRKTQIKRLPFLNLLLFSPSDQEAKQMPYPVLAAGINCFLYCLSLLFCPCFFSLDLHFYVFFKEILTHHECLKQLSEMWRLGDHFWHYLREFITGAIGNSDSWFSLITYLSLPAGKLPTVYLIPTYTYAMWWTASLTLPVLSKARTSLFFPVAFWFVG